MFIIQTDPYVILHIVHKVKYHTIFCHKNYHILDVVHTDQIIQTECKHVPFVRKFTGPLIQILHFHCHLHQFI